MYNFLNKRPSGRFLLILLLFCMPIAGIAETTIYQSRDALGNLVFSDSPQAGAEKFTIPDPLVYETPALPDITAKERVQEKQTSTLYQSLTLEKPQPKTTIWSNPGDFLVQYEIKPALNTAKGHRLVIILDGNPRPGIPGSRYYFTNINRGTHQLKAQVIDAEDNVMLESKPATIYLQQQSVNYPAR